MRMRLGVTLTAMSVALAAHSTRAKSMISGVAQFSDTDSDLVRQYKNLAVRGTRPPSLDISARELPAVVTKRLAKHSLSFSQLPGLLQRAVLWDAGYAFEYGQKLPLVKMYTRCGAGMSDIAVSSDSFAAAGCKAQDCSSLNSSRSLYCTGTQMESASACAVGSEVKTTLNASMWATGGNADTLPEPGVARHSWTDGGQSYLVYAIHTVTSETLYGECPANAKASGMVIPCVDMSHDTKNKWCDPVSNKVVDEWLDAFSTNGTTSTPSPVSSMKGSSAPANYGGKGGKSQPVNHQEKNSDSSFKAEYIVVIVGMFVALVAVAFVVYSRRRKKTLASGGMARYEKDESVVDSMPSYSRMADAVASLPQQQTQQTENLPPEYERKLLGNPMVCSRRISIDDLQMDTTLARKASYTLSVGQWYGEAVVIKRVVGHKGEILRKVKWFADEIQLTASLDHGNIVRFIGVAWASPETLSLVTEYMPNGSVWTMLQHQQQAQENDPISTWTSQKLSWALDVASALAYLHQLTKPVIYRDVKASNVLLQSDMSAKFVDCGVNRDHFDQDQMAMVGKPFWYPPEVLNGSHHSEEGDVYAFGVLLSEIDSCQEPYHDIRGTSREPMANVKLLQGIVRGELRPTFSDECPPHILELAARCLHHDRRQRPSAVQLVEYLTGEPQEYTL